METSPQVSPKEFANLMKQETEHYLKDVMAAVNNAADGFTLGSCPGTKAARSSGPIEKNWIVCIGCAPVVTRGLISPYFKS